MVALGGISLMIMLFVAIGLIAGAVTVIIAIVSVAGKKKKEKQLQQQIAAEQSAMPQQPQDQSNPYLQNFNNKVN